MVALVLTLIPSIWSILPPVPPKLTVGTRSPVPITFEPIEFIPAVPLPTATEDNPILLLYTPIALLLPAPAKFFIPNAVAGLKSPCLTKLYAPTAVPYPFER